MSLNGVGGVPVTVVRPQENVRVRAETQRPDQTAAAATAVPTPKTAATGLLAPQREVVPADAPPGTDPELWSVLTAEERAHFAKMTAMGPLTYGHITQGPRHDVPQVRGGRLDVRI